MIRFIRTHLAWKVFLSYVIVILIGYIVLVTATSLSFPAAFERHIAGMNSLFPGSNPTTQQTLVNELFSNYQAAVTEALSLALLAALVAAVVVSYLISRQIVDPVQRMRTISNRVASGEYQDRLKIPGSILSNQLDELDQLALSFNQMTDKLEKTETIRRQLIGDVSHELRTPLAAVKAYMEGLIDGVLPAGVDTYQKVYSEVDRLQRLVDDLQELSRVEAGAFQLKLEPLSPAGLIERVLSQFKPQLEEKGIRLETRLEPDLPDVYADRDRITQVLTNLVGNAMQYTPAGGKVLVSAAQEKSEVVISVLDSGIGISPDHLPLIFNRFYRTDESRARVSGGSGIGLTIAQALVKAQHGRIWAESAGRDQGSTFHFSLPLAPQG